MKQKPHQTTVYLDADVRDLLNTARNRGMKLQYLYNDALRIYLSKMRGPPPDKRKTQRTVEKK